METFYAEQKMQDALLKVADLERERRELTTPWDKTRNANQLKKARREAVEAIALVKGWRWVLDTLDTVLIPDHEKALAATLR